MDGSVMVNTFTDLRIGLRIIGDALGCLDPGGNPVIGLFWILIFNFLNPLFQTITHLCWQLIPRATHDSSLNAVNKGQSYRVI